MVAVYTLRIIGMASGNKKIRILFTIPNFDTAGTGKVLINLAEALDKDTFEPHIMCIHDRGFLFQRVKESGLPYHIHNYYHDMKPRLRGLKAVWATSRVFRRLKPDIIHSFHYGSDYSEALAAKFARIKWVFTKKNMSWGGSSKNSWKLRSILSRGIIVQNTDMIRDFYPNNEKVVFIPRGVKYEEFDNHGQFGKKEPPRVIICVANLVPRKGVEVLVRAFAMLKEDHPNWHVWIIGDDTNEYAEEVKEEIRDLGIEDRFWFSGKKKDIRPFLTQAEIFVLPTNNMGEGSPVALLEAMANGKVVIGSAVPGIKDQLNPFPEHLFEVDNPRDLAEKLHFFMNVSTGQNQKTGAQFVEYVRLKYAFNAEVKAHSEFYKKIVRYKY